MNVMLLLLQIKQLGFFNVDPAYIEVKCELTCIVGAFLFQLCNGIIL